MITINVIDKMIVGSIGEEGFSIPYTKERYDTLDGFEEELAKCATPEEYNKVLAKAKQLCAEVTEGMIETECEFITVDPKTHKYFLKYNKVISDIAMPQALVDRILESVDKDLPFLPLVKMWVRFLRNPNLRKKNKGGKFAKKFFNFINITYVNPELKAKLMEEGGFNDEVASKRATMYQMKITKEGLLNGYKVSCEVMHKFEADSNGQPQRVDRYLRTFDVNTGKITGTGLPDTVEERLFEPAIQGQSGDAFSCSGQHGFPADGHFIKVGCLHALDSWDKVNIDDSKSCVPGLHVGGLNYIDGIRGEIHSVFIDPMHVGAVPDDSIGALRCKQYFVHGSLAGVNGSIYHSSDYASTTDAEWKSMLSEAILLKNEELKKAEQGLDNLKALTS